MSRILLIDDDPSLLRTMTLMVEAAGHEVLQASDGREALRLVCSALPDIALCDWRMPHLDGKAFLQELAATGMLAKFPTIIFTAFGDGESAMEAMQCGAYDFLVKPVDMDVLLSTLQRALEHSTLQKDLERVQGEQVRSRPGGFAAADSGKEDRIIGSSPLWIEVFKKAGQIAASDLSVLLEGETGTGKEVVARTIHRNSRRSHEVLVTLNCAAIPSELMEAELFGHERGAFTGAVAQRTGCFEQAAGGTLLLDEVGELPLFLQPKLLRVLQERTFQRIGGSKVLKADVRVIAATNKNLQLEVEEKRFRADLYYRLGGYHLSLPPLRERKEDILALAESFLERYASRNATAVSQLSDDARVLLKSYSYPGNIRELEQLMERTAVSAAGRPITASSIEKLLRQRTGEEPRQAATWAGWDELPFHESIAAWERHLLERALRLANGNKADAARRLGIQRRLLYEKLDQHKLR